MRKSPEECTNNQELYVRSVPKLKSGDFIKSAWYLMAIILFIPIFFYLYVEMNSIFAFVIVPVPILMYIVFQRHLNSVYQTPFLNINVNASYIQIGELKVYGQDILQLMLIVQAKSRSKDLLRIHTNGGKLYFGIKMGCYTQLREELNKYYKDKVRYR